MSNNLEKIIGELRKEIKALKEEINTKKMHDINVIYPEYIDRKGIMNVFHISYPTIYTMENCGLLTPIKKKRKILYDYKEVLDYKIKKK